MKPAKAIDAHMHLNDPKYSAADRERILSEMGRLGLSGICSGWDHASSLEAIRIAEKYPFIYATAGLHPGYVDGAQIEFLSELREWGRGGTIAAIGECGLDKCCGTDWNQQRKALELQLDLAESMKLPVVLHVRKAHEEMLRLLSERKGSVRCMLHGCSANWEQVQRYLALGCSISLGGTVTWHNAVKSLRVAASVPVEKLLIETDSPYMLPEPKQGSMNEPRNVFLISRKLSEIRMMPEEILLSKVTWNTEQFFGL